MLLIKFPGGIYKHLVVNDQPLISAKILINIQSWSEIQNTKINIQKMFSAKFGKMRAFNMGPKIFLSTKHIMSPGKYIPTREIVVKTS